MEGQRFALALAFDTDLSEFVRGVEIGRLSEQLKTGEIVAQGVRTDNAEISCGWPRLLDVPCAARSQMTTGSTRLLVRRPEASDEQFKPDAPS
jgi:hypothetical protein